MKKLMLRLQRSSEFAIIWTCEQDFSVLFLYASKTVVFCFAAGEQDCFCKSKTVFVKA